MTSSDARSGAARLRTPLEIHEDPDMAPHPVPLADDAEADAGVAPIEVVEELAQGAAGSVNGGPAHNWREEWARKPS
jgi:hypothetical protein